MSPFRSLLSVTLLTLSTAIGAHSAPLYQMERVIKVGDPAGQWTLASRPVPYAFNDHGQILLEAIVSNKNETIGNALLWYDKGRLTPIAVAGEPAPLPGGKWPTDLSFGGNGRPASTNQQGDVVFTATGQGKVLGVFLQDHRTRAVHPVAAVGTAATDQLTFADPQGLAHGLINNQSEIVFEAVVANSSGQRRQGIFFRSPEGTLTQVVLEGQALPDQAIVGPYHLLSSLNDAGVVTFTAEGHGYLREKGTTVQVAAPDTPLPNVGPIYRVRDLWVNNRDRSVLVMAAVAESGKGTLCRYREGRLTPLVVPGQPMPGGGKLVYLNAVYPGSGVSPANDAGQHTVIAFVDDGATDPRIAVYLIDAEDTLSLIIKDGTPTPLGQLLLSTPIYAAVNGQGQVALSAEFDLGGGEYGPAGLLVLTPSRE